METRNRNRDLIRENLDLLNQAVVLLERLPDDAYRVEVDPLGQRVGSQMRHVLEFYDCFLRGLPCQHVDYSDRQRDTRVETEARFAAEHARALVDELAASRDARSDGAMWVRSDEADDYDPGDRFVLSTVDRELQSLVSHTVHHYAIIGLLLKARGIPVEREFGVSRSTLRYWRKMAEQEVAA